MSKWRAKVANLDNATEKATEKATETFSAEEQGSESEESVEQETMQKVKKKKNFKLPRPRRRMSGYFIWLNENRESIRKIHPELSLNEFHKLVGELWRELSESEKSVSICLDTNPFVECFQKHLV